MKLSLKSIFDAFTPLETHRKSDYYLYTQEEMKEINRKNIINTIKYVSEGNINLQHGFLIFQEDVETLQDEIVNFDFLQKIVYNSSNYSQ